MEGNTAKAIKTTRSLEKILKRLMVIVDAQYKKMTQVKQELYGQIIREEERVYLNPNKDGEFSYFDDKFFISLYLFNKTGYCDWQIETKRIFGPGKDTIKAGVMARRLVESVYDANGKEQEESRQYHKIRMIIRYSSQSYLSLWQALQKTTI